MAAAPAAGGVSPRPCPLVVPDESSALVGVFDSPVFVPPLNKEVGRRTIHSLRHQKSGRAGANSSRSIRGLGCVEELPPRQAAATAPSTIAAAAAPSEAVFPTSDGPQTWSHAKLRSARQLEGEVAGNSLQLPFDVPHTSPLLQYFKGEAEASLKTVASTLQGICINPLVLTFGHPLTSFGLLQLGRASGRVAPGLPSPTPAARQPSTKSDMGASVGTKASDKEEGEEARVRAIVTSFETSFRVRGQGGEPVRRGCWAGSVAS